MGLRRFRTENDGFIVTAFSVIFSLNLCALSGASANPCFILIIVTGAKNECFRKVQCFPVKTLSESLFVNPLFFPT